MTGDLACALRAGRVGREGRICRQRQDGPGDAPGEQGVLRPRRRLGAEPVHLPSGREARGHGRLPPGAASGIRPGRGRCRLPPRGRRQDDPLAARQPGPGGTPVCRGAGGRPLHVQPEPDPSRRPGQFELQPRPERAPHRWLAAQPGGAGAAGRDDRRPHREQDPGGRPALLVPDDGRGPDGGPDLAAVPGAARVRPCGRIGRRPHGGAARSGAGEAHALRLHREPGLPGPADEHARSDPHQDRRQDGLS